MQNRYAIDSVDKALQLLLILQSDSPVRLTRAAEELGVARSTAHRLLGTLVGRGFATQDEHRRYLPGPRLVTMPHGGEHQASRLRLLARRHLRRLSRRSGETVHLMTRDGRKVRFLDSIEGTHALRIGSRVGVVLPAQVTAGGKAMLADLDRARLDDLYRDHLDAERLDRLARSLLAVRQRGYATNVGQTERGLTALGARVCEDGRTVAALTLSAPSIRMAPGRLAEWTPVLLDAAHCLESDLADGQSASAPLRSRSCA